MAATSQDRNQDARPTPSPFGNLLKRLRVSANLTQEELAERAGVSTRLISDLERGVVQRSRRDTVEMLADALHLEATARATFAALSRRRQAAGSTDARERVSPAVSLPHPPTSFVGREREVGATTALLLQPETRILTLTGPGGVGKTRLAIETAGRATSAFPDGVAFIDLSPISDPDQVVGAISSALELASTGDDDPLEALAAALADASRLLVLDNMEHLIEAGTALSVLVERNARLKLLITSRQHLQLHREREYVVRPLGLPTADERGSVEALLQNPAVQLFVSRAESAQPAFTLSDESAGAIAAIVTRLDGLPLAIELAAARMRLLAPQELLQRLNRSLPILTGGPRDVPDRQQTLRGAIDWSFKLLQPEERRLFAWLSVFCGGFTLDAVEYLVVQMEAASPESALDMLASLLDKSLIQRLDTRASDPAAAEVAGGGSRYRMLETIREYGLERLGAMDERDAVRDHHAAWYTDLATQSDAGLNSPEQAAWLMRLQQEHDNFRAALDWAIEMGQAETALTTSGSLLRYWVSVGQFREARKWYELALALDPESESGARAKALLGIEVICYFQGDYAAAKRYGEEGLRIFQALNDEDGIAKAYGNLGLVADAEEDYDRANDLYTRALAIFRKLGDLTHTHFMLGNLGLIAHFQGDQDRAAGILEESLALSRQVGNQNSVSINLSNLGLVAFARSDFDRAADLQTEALKIRVQIGNLASLARSYDNFALIAVERNDYERASRLFGMAEGLRSETGTALQPNDAEFNRHYIERTQAALGQERFIELWGDGAAMSADEAVAYALSREQPAPVERSAGA